jgi:hypothetical protein
LDETPLIDKLGIKIETNISIIGAPDNYDYLIGDWPMGVSVSRDVFDEQFDLIHLFVTKKADFEAKFTLAATHIQKDGMIWVSWPKLASGFKTDLNENIIREFGLSTGLVDVKVAAIDAIWSGLKFVYRVEDR